MYNDKMKEKFCERIKKKLEIGRKYFKMLLITIKNY